MRTKKVLNMTIITLGIYYSYQATLSLLLKFGSFSTAGTIKSSIDIYTVIMNIIVLIIGLTLITKPTIITKSVKYNEDETNKFVDLFAIEQIILKIVSVLLIMYNVQVSIFQAATLNEYLLLGSYEDQIMWMKMDIFVRVTLAIVGIIIYWKSYSLSKFIFKDR